MARKRANFPVRERSLLARLSRQLTAAVRASAKAVLPPKVVGPLQRAERRIEAQRLAWERRALRVRERWVTRMHSLQGRIGSVAADVAREVASRLGVASRAEVEGLRKRIGELEGRIVRGGSMGEVRRTSAV